MTRRDYVLIAQALAASQPADASHHGEAAHSQWVYTCKKVAAKLAAVNHSFEGELFLTNCGVDTP